MSDRRRKFPRASAPIVRRHGFEAGGRLCGTWIRSGTDCAARIGGGIADAPQCRRACRMPGWYRPKVGEGGSGPT